MTQKDIDWVFEWTQFILEQSKWCNKVGKENVMEMTRQALQDWTNEMIIPCGMSWGTVTYDNDNKEYWENKDKELKEVYQKDIKPFDKYWIYHNR